MNLSTKIFNAFVEVSGGQEKYINERQGLDYLMDAAKQKAELEKLAEHIFKKFTKATGGEIEYVDPYQAVNFLASNLKTFGNQ